MRKTKPCTGAIKRLLPLAFASFALLMLGCTLKDDDDLECELKYVIDEGYDFATGEEITVKKGKNKKTIWVKRSEGYSKLYRKYHLSYPEPLFSFYCGTEYYRKGPPIAWDGFEQVDHWFFEMLARFDNLPQEEVKAIFEHSIALRKNKDTDFGEISAYQRKEYDRYSAPGIKEEINAYFRDPSQPFPCDYKLRGDNAVIRYFIEHRSDFPELLPHQFYMTCLDEKLGFFAPEHVATLCRGEYQNHPSTMNAFLAAYANIGYWANERNEITQDSFSFTHASQYPRHLFEDFHKAGILDAFLKTVLPEDKLPAMRENLRLQLAPGFISSTVKNWVDHKCWLSDASYLEDFLLWITNAKALEAHFREQFAKAYAERIAKE